MSVLVVQIKFVPLTSPEAVLIFNRRLILLSCRLFNLFWIVTVLSVTAIRCASAPRTLPLTDAAHTAVLGIVCDNLAGMPASQRNHLYLPLPADLLQASLSLSLSEDATSSRNGLKTGLDTLNHLKQRSSLKPARTQRSYQQQGRTEASTLGTIERAGDHLLYTPPDEFNRTPFPQRLQDITRSYRRTIVLTVRMQDAESATAIVAQQPIVLARPPVVMVHGINTSTHSTEWAGRNTLAAILPEYGVTPVLVDHGSVDFNLRDPRAFPALAFAGNGPVEHVAQQLAETVAQTLRRVHDEQHLAIRRVDLIGHSYGGLICRWYLHSFRHDPRTADSVHWYIRSLNSGAPDGLYRINPDWYQQQLAARVPPAEGTSMPSAEIEVPVRKCITLASMWRGVPLCNYANEVHAPDIGGPRLANAPLFFGTMGSFVDGRFFSLLLPTRVPAIEVMAVNSPWLDALNNYQENGERKPFLDSVAYGCVAGDNDFSVELPVLSFAPYKLLRSTQIPSWFPYVALEYQGDTINNYTDGLVPLWSTLPTDNQLERDSEGEAETDISNEIETKRSFISNPHWVASRIVHSNHVSVLTDIKAREYVLCALNNSSWLPTGRMLNPRWGYPITSRVLYPVSQAETNRIAQQHSPLINLLPGAAKVVYAPERVRKTWTFHSAQMAPDVQNALYPQIALLGRINPRALREICDVRISLITSESADVSWQTAVALNGEVTVTMGRWVDSARYEDVEVPCRIEPIGHVVTQTHHFRLSGLQPNTTYHLIVTSDTIEDPAAIVSVRSAVLSFSTKR